MRLKTLELPDYKNLNDFHVRFSIESPFSVLIGNNGTGKSNLIEAILIIFRDLDLGMPAAFPYEITYSLHAGQDTVDVRVIAEAGKAPRIGAGSAPMSKFNHERDQELLPRFIFAYYSGSSNRLEQHFARSRHRFYEKLISPDAGDSGLPIRRLFLAQQLHSQFVLLAFFVDPDERARQFLRDNLRIASMKDVTIVVKRPDWSKDRTDRFWGASGAPRRTLELLDRYAVSVLDESRTIDTTFRRRTRLDCRVYSLDERALKEMYLEFGEPHAFFAAIESLHISELLLEIVARVELVEGGSITFSELSEGEQQLLLVLGLLRFTRQKDSLFLLDEPDTHLNPNWAIQYRSFIHGILESEYNSHVLCATHDPLTFCGSLRSDVRVLKREESGRITATPAEVDPRGLGVGGILTSEMFGLRAALDIETQHRLEKLRDLQARSDLTDAESEKMDDLQSELADLGFMTRSDDPLFARYLAAYNSLFGVGELDTPLQQDVLRARAEAALGKALHLAKDAAD